MPRKAKDKNEEKEVKTTKKTVKKETTKAKKGVVKTEKNKKVSKSTASSGTSKKKVTADKGTIKKVTPKKKDDSKKDLTKSTKKVTKKTTNTTKANTKSKTKKDEPISVIEYYDLPYRYNQTIVKILAQTPKMLFVYWDISDSDRKAFEENFGDDFFNKTKPVLIVHNETINYSFEIEINDFANSWYLHVNDANCKYEIELGRRPYNYLSTIPQNYIYVTSSNKMDAPNNHILFEKFNPSVTYKNTKTGMKSKRDFGSLANYKNMQAIYNIYDLYKKIYKDDLFNEISNNDLLNPSSMSSSFMESSRS